VIPPQPILHTSLLLLSFLRDGCPREFLVPIKVSKPLRSFAYGPGWFQAHFTLIRNTLRWVVLLLHALGGFLRSFASPFYFKPWPLSNSNIFCGGFAMFADLGFCGRPFFSTFLGPDFHTVLVFSEGYLADLLKFPFFEKGMSRSGWCPT